MKPRLMGASVIYCPLQETLNHDASVVDVNATTLFRAMLNDFPVRYHENLTRLWATLRGDRHLNHSFAEAYAAAAKDT